MDEYILFIEMKNGLVYYFQICYQHRMTIYLREL